MTNKSTNTNKTLIDALFVIPEGAEEAFVYSRDGVDTDEYDDLDYTELEELFDDGDDKEDDLDIGLDWTIVKQTLRRAPGGQQVVDVIININEVDGATKYEVQVTKA